MSSTPQHKTQEKIKEWIFYIILVSIIVGIGYWLGNPIFDTEKEIKLVKVESTLELSSGDHIAEVSYYNPNTETESNYTLTVEVSVNQLVRIYWPNGGWLDTDDFDMVYFDSGGYCSFITDRGYEYTVEITDLK